MAIDDILKLIMREGEDLGRTVIRKKAEQMALPAKKRVKPTSERLMPETTEAYKRTVDMVPQVPFRAMQPDLRGGANLPAGGRMGPLIEAQEDIAQELSGRIRPAIGSSDQYFYHTGPLAEAAANAGVPPDVFMKRFSSYFAGTSPRTQTEPNLLNSTMLQYRAAEGLPLDKPVLGLAGPEAANDVGYAMITGMHPSLAGRLEIDPMGQFATNPKPSSFGLNTAGNLQGVTADTHAIRGALLSFDARYPRQLPRQWFKSDEAFGRYREGGIDAVNLESDINDSLASATTRGVTSQVEYGPMADIYERTSGLLDVAPAEAQALGWFGLGENTGLKSASRSIVGLMNDRINVTAQLLGLPQDVVARLYFQGRIPLAGVAGAGAGAGLLADTGEANAAEIEQYLQGSKK
jgi:hypothetical protein